MFRAASRILVITLLALLLVSAYPQSAPPSIYQVIMYSGTSNMTVPVGAKDLINQPTGLNRTDSFVLPNAVPNFFSQNALNSVNGTPQAGPIIFNSTNYSVSNQFVQLSSALNTNIATALSIIPLSSPASGVINRVDPETGGAFPESSTLGPIFTERAETIGKGHFYIGFSNQDFHFTKFNGTSLNALNVLYQGGDPTKVFPNTSATSPLATVPATIGLGLDIRLSQDIAFLTYGLTDRIDVSVGLPAIHSSFAARAYNGVIYAGNAFITNNVAPGGSASPSNNAWWAGNTFTPGFPTITYGQFGQASLSKTGFGDMLIRGKGTVKRTKNAVVAVGADLRLPTGDEQNYLGVGTTSVKPFFALSFYTKPFKNGVVLSPHMDAGWQFSGKSILGGQLQATPLSVTATVNTPNGPNTVTAKYAGAPFTSTKDYLPDVFSWAVGAELALGSRNTVIADILGNEVGWIHGTPGVVTRTMSNLLLPVGPNGDPFGNTVPNVGSASGLVGVSKISYGQYSGSFGYKVRIAGNLVAHFSAFVRFDDNGLTAGFVPLVGLGYSFGR